MLLEDMESKELLAQIEQMRQQKKRMLEFMERKLKRFNHAIRNNESIVEAVNQENLTDCY